MLVNKRRGFTRSNCEPVKVQISRHVVHTFLLQTLHTRASISMILSKIYFYRYGESPPGPTGDSGPCESRAELHGPRYPNPGPATLAAQSSIRRCCSSIQDGFDAFLNVGVDVLDRL